MARALPFGLLRLVGLLPLRRRHAGIVRCLRRLAELGFEFRNPPLCRVKSPPDRADQRIFLCIAQIIELGEPRHPAFRIDSTVTVSTRLLLPSPARCLCLTARFATRDEQRHLFGDATRIARALGLDIELPDFDNEDPSYWERVHTGGGYKSRIDGKIADPWWNGDPDWSLLLRLPWGEVWFDIEEGVKLFLVADDIPRAPLLIDSLREKGIRFTDENEKSLVRFSCVRLADDV
jgi:hypothetical protein